MQVMYGGAGYFVTCRTLLARGRGAKHPFPLDPLPHNTQIQNKKDTLNKKNRVSFTVCY